MLPWHTQMAYCFLLNHPDWISLTAFIPQDAFHSICPSHVIATDGMNGISSTITRQLRVCRCLLGCCNPVEYLSRNLTALQNSIHWSREWNSSSVTWIMLKSAFLMDKKSPAETPRSYLYRATTYNPKQFHEESIRIFLRTCGTWGPKHTGYEDRRRKSRGRK